MRDASSRSHYPSRTQNQDAGPSSHVPKDLGIPFHRIQEQQRTSELHVLPTILLAQGYIRAQYDYTCRLRLGDHCCQPWTILN